ncbi:MAG: septal ring lytic transglycosylase RlpA family protein [Thermoflavifilum sp.]|nr:septal ring lytic transglycosylase RlpA family protein [Thermoflavifilum sp.]
MCFSQITIWGIWLATIFSISVHAQSQNAHNSTVYYGIASFYGKKFHHQLTASGDTFDMHQFTAASNRIAMHQYVLVTNLRNQRKALVKINDRMAPTNPRLIDVSEAVARKLRFHARGLTRVKVELVPQWLIDWFGLAEIIDEK